MILTFILHHFLSQEPQSTTGGFIKVLSKLHMLIWIYWKCGGITWLIVGSLASSIWKTGGGSVCWRTWRSCWDWPHTAIALVKWSTPFSSSPGYKNSIIASDELTKMECHVYILHILQMNKYRGHGTDLWLGAPLPFGFPPGKTSEQLLGPLNQVASEKK